MNITFRNINSNNQKELLELNEMMEQLMEKAHDIHKLADIIDRYNHREDAYLLGAFDEESGQMCGSMLGIIFEDYCGECKPLMIVENVVVHQDYRQKGIGKLMFDEIEQWGKTHNVNYALLCSDMEREGAHQFYRAIGCKEVKGFKKYM